MMHPYLLKHRYVAAWSVLEAQLGAWLGRGLLATLGMVYLQHLACLKKWHGTTSICLTAPFPLLATHLRGPGLRLWIVIVVFLKSEQHNQYTFIN